MTEKEWVAKRVGNNWHVTMDRPDRPPIAWVGGGCSSHAKANAYLMAAAPVLLRELSHLVKLLGPLEEEGSLDMPGLATLNGARAAIRKAKK